MAENRNKILDETVYEYNGINTSKRDHLIQDAKITIHKKNLTMLLEPGHYYTLRVDNITLIFFVL